MDSTMIAEVATLGLALPVLALYIWVVYWVGRAAKRYATKGN